MTRSGCGGEATKEFKDKFSVCGNANVRPGWARGPRPKRGGAVAQGTTKRLTFREGRLRLPLGTTRLESQAFRWPCGGPMVLALIFSVHFASRQKGQEKECVAMV